MDAPGSVVFDLADRISVLVYGEIIATGSPAEIRANRAVHAQGVARGLGGRLLRLGSAGGGE